MSIPKWISWAGLAAILGGILMMVLENLWFLGHGPTGVDQRQLIFGLQNQFYRDLTFIPAVLVLYALVAFHSQHKQSYSRPARAGFMITSVGYIVGLLGNFLQYHTFYFGHPVVVAGFILDFFVAWPLLIIGWSTFGFAFIRMSVIPQWTRFLLLLLGMAFAVPAAWFFVDPAPESGYPPSVIGAVLQGLGWLLLGTSMISQPRTQVADRNVAS